MSNLKSQLLKSGLVDAKRAKKVHQQQLEAGKNAKNETKEAVQKAMAEKAEKDRLLNLQRKEEQEKKAIVAQIKQLIESNKIDRAGGEVAYQFTDDKKIKKLYISDVQFSQITKGIIAIVRFADGYELVPARVAEKIASRDANLVL
ncbi:MAG: DUF2058 domain-containing protein, partial [Pseudomonadales bacterium]|nr:DUF2058 domain-containing protein [Pseudomonadales bacterium]